MNLLEHHIQEVHNVKDLGDGYVEVNLTWDCWGSVSTGTQLFKEEDWETAKAKGYFMS